MRCEASGITLTQDGHKVACPTCGKLVKLRAKYRAHGYGALREPARSFRVVPVHNKPANAKAQRKAR